MTPDVLYGAALYAVIARLCVDAEPCIRAVGATLLVAHAVHDVAAPASAWPMWMEPIALALGALLATHAPRPSLPFWAGVAMIAAHTRQLAWRDDRYYRP